MELLENEHVTEKENDAYNAVEDYVKAMVVELTKPERKALESAVGDMKVEGHFVCDMLTDYWVDVLMYAFRFGTLMGGGLDKLSGYYQEAMEKRQVEEG